MKKYFFRFFKSMFIFTIGLILLTGCSANLAELSEISNADNSGKRMVVSEFINHETGGRIQLNNEISLYIPANSLSEDKEITIEKITTNPKEGADGLSQFGQAYRLLPEGTTFDLNKPAVLEMKYDSVSMTKMGLSPKTTQVYYYDVELGKYVNVTCNVNIEEGKITAYLEHFTIYLSMARGDLSGNISPIVALQTPVPNPMRAGAPIYVRATARDFNSGGSIAGVKLYYRKLQPVVGAWQEANMVQEIRPNILHTYGYLIPAGFLTSADLGAGNDIEFYVKATDNLNVTSQTGINSYNVTRSYQPGTIYVTPGSRDITAGYEIYFNTRGTDDSSANFTFVSEIIRISKDIGIAENHKAGGILFHAKNNGQCTLDMGFGTEMASANITVHNGSLDRILILDENSHPIEGTISIKEGQKYKFDAIGYDVFGNSIRVLPDWISDPSILGAINYYEDMLNHDAFALLYTLDGAGFGTVTASLGNITSQQYIHVLDREWVVKGGSILNDPNKYANSPSLAFNGSTPYVAWSENNDSAEGQIYVKYWTGSGWAQIGGSVNQGGSSSSNPSLAFNGSTPYVTWIRNNGLVNEIYVKHWNGSTWVHLDPRCLNVDTSHNAGSPSLAFNGSTLYVVWEESDSTSSKIYVKHWNGSAWIQDGGGLNVDVSKNAHYPSLSFSGSTPYVAWYENDGTTNQIYVKHWNGSTWIQDGGSLNVDVSKDAYYPSLSFSESTPSGKENPEIIPYVTWQENDGAANQIYVKHWNGSTWIQDGGSLNVDVSKNASFASLSFYDSTPYVAWAENNQAYVKHWNGSTWVQNGATLNVAGGTTAYFPFLVFNGSTPYVTWLEVQSLTYRIFVKSFE